MEEIIENTLNATFVDRHTSGNQSQIKIWDPPTRGPRGP